MFSEPLKLRVQKRGRKMQIKIVFMILCFVVLASSYSAQARDWDQLEAQAGKALFIPELKLVRRDAPHGVLFAYVEQDVNPGKYSCTSMDGSQAAQAADALEHSVAAVGETALSRGNLKYVLLCDQSYAQGNAIGGIPVPPLKVLMLSVGGAGDEYAQRLFCHELYHYLEFVLARGIRDAQWDQRFSGYEGGYGQMNGGKGRMGSGDTGFVSAYAQTLAEEDRAEIFSFMMADPQGLRNYVRTHNDSVLREKVEYVRDKAAREFGVRRAAEFEF